MTYFKKYFYILYNAAMFLILYYSYVKEKHEKGRKWAKLKKNPPRVGPKGYRGNVDRWEKERASEELCTDVHKIPDRRGRHYCLARRVHDKVKGLMLSPEMQVIADQLVRHC